MMKVKIARNAKSNESMKVNLRINYRMAEALKKSTKMLNKKEFSTKDYTLENLMKRIAKNLL